MLQAFLSRVRAAVGESWRLPPRFSPHSFLASFDARSAGAIVTSFGFVIRAIGARGTHTFFGRAGEASLHEFAWQTVDGALLNWPPSPVSLTYPRTSYVTL